MYDPSLSFLRQDSSGTSIFTLRIFLKRSKTLRFERSENRSAAGLGFEPRLHGPEPRVLPLDDPAFYHLLPHKERAIIVRNEER